jgi:YegS/Rv2252/BmrU family lipid kinase
MGVQLKTALVMNPRAGGKRADSLRRRLAAEFGELVPDGEIRQTSAQGDAENLVRALLEEGVECVAVAGGDGTLNEAVNGYFRPIPPDAEPDPDTPPEPVNPGACIAVIPVGTGGDFRRTLGLEPDPLAALSLLTGSSLRSCDVGHASFRARDGGRGSRFFLNITSFGLSGMVDEYVNQSSHSLPGSLNFFIATVRAFYNYHNVRVRVLLDDTEQWVETAVTVAVANGRFFGGGMEVAPGASLDDGLLDVVVLGDLQLVDFIVHSRLLYGGRILEHPLVQHCHVRRVLLDAVEESDVMIMDMDGEPLGRLPAELRVFPGALRIKT